MITIGTVFDVYLNINILLFVAFGVWAVTHLAMRFFGMSHAYPVKLSLIKALFAICFIAPVLVFLFDQFVRQTGASSFSLSLSDLIVSQYLQGSFDMKAAELNSMLGLRARLTEDVLGMQSNFALIAVSLLALGWIIGIARLALSMVKLHKILNRCFAWRSFGNVHLLLSQSVTTPFSTRGLFNRYIVLPTSMLEQSKDMRIALAHELQHIRQQDTEWEIFLEFIRPIFFWNPAFCLFKKQMEQMRELCCDQQVLTRKSVSIQDYCECLLRTCENSLKKREIFVEAMPHVAFVQIERSLIGTSSTQFLRERLLSIVEGEKRQWHGWTLLAFMTPVLALVGLASVTLQKPNDWSHERIMFSTVINLDRLAERNR